jgi:hypothetical protein
MNGSIVFKDAAALAEFLKAFTGSSAGFRVVEESRGFVLTFDGGF